MTKPPETPTPPSSQTDQCHAERLEEAIEREIHDLIPDETRAAIVEKVAAVAVGEHFAGPLPHPSHLSGYERTCPGSADRIIAMAEREQIHRIEMERRTFDADAGDRTLGMWLGAGSFVLLILGAVLTAIFTDSTVIPGLFLGTAAIGGVSLFVRGRQNGN